MVGLSIKQRKEGPQDRRSTWHEQIEFEKGLVEIHNTQMQAENARLNGKWEQAAKLEQDERKIQQRIEDNLASASNTIQQKYMGLMGDQWKRHSKDLDEMKLLGTPGAMSNRGAAIFHEHSSLVLDATTFPDLTAKLSKIPPMEAYAVLMALQQMGKDVPAMMESTDFGPTNAKAQMEAIIASGEAAYNDLDNQLIAKEQQALEAKTTLDQAKYAIKAKLAEGGKGGTGGTSLQAPRGSIAGVMSGQLDTKAYIAKIRGQPDIRPASDQMLEAIRGSDVYISAMHADGLDPNSLWDQKRFEKKARKSLRLAERAMKEAERRGIPVEETRAMKLREWITRDDPTDDKTTGAESVTGLAYMFAGDPTAAPIVRATSQISFGESPAPSEPGVADTVLEQATGFQNIKETLATSGGGTHTMQEGDTLAEIAAANDISVADLQAANPDIGDVRRIPIGAVVKLPGQMIDPATPMYEQQQREAEAEREERLAGGQRLQEEQVASAAAEAAADAEADAEAALVAQRRRAELQVLKKGLTPEQTDRGAVLPSQGY